VKDGEEATLLPKMSCHILRHTFATRQVESGINLKVIQETLGHADIKTTLNIYADASDELKSNEFDKLQKFLQEQNM
jgi:integrase